ncbi:midasin [Schizosaccharomyces octosporus yFS286]|uniref:Midasin n=1 Tax=Schizosaccharomyces octosporus (strain yFS286) TaxID=483514 RepID=S9R5S6_SCHOY|nr:midasin [Schizosaccharomyces octosporus yFS286]EPX73650.1 midasin [Schizosaccharomyces octosporus yFS286]
MDELIEWVVIYPQIFDILEHINYVPKTLLQRIRLHRSWSKVDYDLWFLYASDEKRKDCKIDCYGQLYSYDEFLVLEDQRIAKLNELAKARSPNENSNFLRQLLSNAKVNHVPLVELGGELFFQFNESLPTTLVETESVKENLSRVSPFLVRKQPLLLAGPEGMGKTYFITQIAALLGQRIVRIHLTDSTDPKMLIGTYTCPRPGEFEWQPGVLTQAVRHGKWLLLSNIEKAPAEVLSILLPLLEKRQLVVPSRGETIYAANSFQVFATSSTNSTILGQRLWKTIEMVSAPHECVEIVSTIYPELSTISRTLFSVYNDIYELFSNRTFLAVSRVYRRLCLRDFYKFMKRVAFLYRNFHVSVGHTTISQELQDAIFKEAIDVFSAFIPNKQGVDNVVRNIAIDLNISPEKAEHFFEVIPSFHDSESAVTVGRSKLPKVSSSAVSTSNPYAFTSSSLSLLEKISVAVQTNEPLLLVGETGTGKTTTVQLLANLLGQKVTVINMSQQTESSDMLGGYKPINITTLGLPLHEEFMSLFETTFSVKKNMKFVAAASTSARRFRWKTCLKIWNEALSLSKSLFSKTRSQENPMKRQKRLANQPALEARWNKFNEEVEQFSKMLEGGSKSFMFSFVEGALVKAIRSGHWVLLDEINLASMETLEPIGQLLNSYEPGILLSDRGDVNPVIPHPNFRLFGCMNPSTDVGKRELETSLRSRFTEIYVESPDRNLSDLLSIISKYIGTLCIGDDHVIRDIAELYQIAKRLSIDGSLVDGAGQKPHYTIRTLSRTLCYVAEIVPIYGLRRSLYEGFCMSFLTLLDQNSENLLYKYIERYTLGELSVQQKNAILRQIPKRPDVGDYVAFCHYWLRKGSFPVRDQEHYIVTPFVQKNLLNITRACSTRMFPILIQGPTSSGKTSMIEYIAGKTGHKFVRINNHEHTDLQEYLGSYVTDDKGSLVFKEGILVEALKNGYWIVLDELNLAPTDVLEALNRLLDDNRELFIPETESLVKPHPDFMLFATQNPPGVYAGRKHLSRAFRNRFLEIHFDDIPENELETILHMRCKIAPSYASKIVQVFRELSLRRQSTRIFEQKNSFATLRDLFRWAFRDAVGYDQLAENGYMLLAERARDPNDKLAVQEVIEKVMKVKINTEKLYRLDFIDSIRSDANVGPLDNVVWTAPMIRLFSLVWHCLQAKEPVLLVGDTGCGKTTVCQVLAECLSKQLHIVNAHQDTENGDIIGAQRPLRNRSLIKNTLHIQLSEKFNVSQDKYPVEDLITKFESLSHSEKADDLSVVIEKHIKKFKSLFEWHDGALVSAMKGGDFFLLDEISLADDSVLERLNSVLEISRTLTLVEHNDAAVLTANEGFAFFATMNPGGDYGKKELSPALRNRFTEIWVPPMTSINDILQIVEGKLIPMKKHLGEPLVHYAYWHSNVYQNGTIISIRDVLSAVDFINSCELSDDMATLFHAVSMVFIDALGAISAVGFGRNKNVLLDERKKCASKLGSLCGSDFSYSVTDDLMIRFTESSFYIGDFGIKLGSNVNPDTSYNLSTHTTKVNAAKVVRALQVRKPILLEGSPGVGKTSLISALARECGYPLIRINLSDQTDLMDLFGSDAPVNGGEGGQFAWRDAPFLSAMRHGHWVLLDELNLASQTVLEGLNACLDHRGEAYIPELDRVFKAHPNFRVFAAQNPQSQGGGRKGLPKSFVNRFTVVYVEPLLQSDMLEIASQNYRQVDENMRFHIIEFMFKLQEYVEVDASFGASGSPWEFNLRDAMRWLQLLSEAEKYTCVSPSEYLEVVVLHRMRTSNDRQRVIRLFEEVFDVKYEPRLISSELDSNVLKVGHSFLNRSSLTQNTSLDNTKLLQSQYDVLESMITCINKNWPCILVGPSASGKTRTIRLLAAVCGVDLKEMAINSEIDTMDLLGEYEQVDISRKISAFLLQLSHDVLNVLIEHEEIKEILKGTSLLRVLGTSFVTLDEGLHLLEWVIAEIRSIRHHTIVFKHLRPYFTHAGKLIKEASVPATGKFEWIDGYLLRAVENGHWLVLDNANLCSPAVLDRLNSLLESGGTLTVNERPTESGMPKVIKPHPNFRLFLTVNPYYGELSRAMRNRGVEIYMLNNDPTPLDNRQLSVFSPSPICSAVDAESSNLSFVIDTHRRLSELETNLVSPYVIAAVVFSYFSNGQLACLKNLFDDKKTPSLEKLPYINALQQADFSNGRISDEVLKYIKTYEYPLLLTSMSLVSIMNDFTSIASSDCGSEVFWKAYLLNVLYAAQFDLQHINQEVYSSVQSGSISTYLLRSAYAFLHGVSYYKGALSSVWKLLNDLSVYIFNSIDKLRKNSSLISVDDLLNFLNLIALWKSMYEWTGTFEFDFSRFHCYSLLLKEWSTKFVADHKSKYLDAPHGLISKFSETLQLSTGEYMQNIWSHYHPLVPKTKEHWSLWSKIDTLLKEYLRANTPSLGMEATASHVVTTTLSLLMKVIQQHESQDLDSYMQILEEGVLALKNSRQEQLPEAFYSAFNCLAASDLLTIYTANINNFNVSSEAFTNYVHAALYTRGTVSPLSVITNLNFNASQIPFAVLFDYDFFSLVNGNTFDLLTRAFASIDEHLNMASVRRYEDMHQTLTRHITERSMRFSENPIERAGILLLQRIPFFILTEINCDRLSADEERILKALALPYEELKNNCTSYVDELVRYFENNTRFNASYINHILNSLGYLRKSLSTTNHENACKDQAAAYIHFSCGLLLAYVPDKPYDPALLPLLSSANCTEVLNSLSGELEIVKLMEVNKSGKEDNLLTKSIYSRIEEINRSIPTSTGVFRSLESNSTSLFDELRFLMDNVVNNSYALDLSIKLTQSPDNSTLEEARIFKYKWTAFVERLREAYPQYTDIFEIVISLISYIVYGIDMLVAQAKRVLDHRVAASASLMSHLISPQKLSKPLMFEDVQDIIRLTSDLQLNAALKFEVLLFATAKLCRERNDIPKSSAANSFIVLANEFFVYHTKIVQKEQEEEEEKHRLFRQRGLNLENNEYMQVFINYDEEVEEQPEERLERTRFSQLQYAFWTLYKSFFIGNEETCSFEQLLDIGSYLIRKLGLSDFEKTISADFDIVAAVLCLGVQSSKGAAKYWSPPVYNFYLDPHPSKLIEVREILIGLQLHTNSLLKSWPDNFVLRGLKEATDLTLGMAISTPIAQMLSKIERLHHLLSEWEKLASRQFSLVSDMDLIKNKIIEWRQFELSNWKNLLLWEEYKLVEKTYPRLYTILDFVILQTYSRKYTLDKSSLNEIASVIMQFFNGLSVGEYRPCLSNLLTFTKHLEVLDESTELCATLQQIYSYLKLFESNITHFISVQRDDLEKKIKERILLMSWKDTNVYALKENARKSHMELYKTLHKYREVLRQPVTPHMSQKLHWEMLLKPINVQTETLKKEVTIDYAALTLDNAVYANLPARFYNTDSTVRVMKSLLKFTYPADTMFTQAVDEIVNSAHELFKLTPSTATDENISEIKHLKTRKHLLMVNSYKTLHSFGFQYRVRAGIEETMKSLQNLFSNVPAFPVSFGLIDDLNTSLSTVLDLIPKVHRLPGNQHDDLTTPEVARAIGLFDSALSWLLEERLSLVNFAKSLESIKSAYRGIGIDGSLKLNFTTSVFKQAENFDYMDFRKYLRELSALCSIYSVILSKHHQVISNDKYAAVSARLSEYSSQVSRDLTSNSNPLFISDEQFDSLTSAKAAVNDLLYYSRDRAASMPDALYWSKTILSSVKPESTFVHKKISDSDIRYPAFEKLTALFDQLLSSAEEVSKCVKSLESDNTDHTLSNQSTLINKLLTAFKLDLFVFKLSDLKEFFERKELDSDTVRLFMHFLPVCEQYIFSAEQAFTYFLVKHAKESQGLHKIASLFLMVATNGFCTPDIPQDENSREGGDLESGTGLGSGTGAKDITDTVNEDDDLEELANEEDTNEQDELEENSEARELDTEMSGATKDAPASDVESNSDDEEKELDEEINKDNEGLSEDLNEKMWDEPNEEELGENEEKSNEQSAQNNTSDLVSKEEEKENGDRNELENPDNDNKDEESDSEAPGVDDEVQQDAPDDAPQHPENNEILELPDDLKLDEGKEEEGGDDDEDISEDVEDSKESEQADRENEEEQAEQFEEYDAQDNLEEDIKEEEGFASQDENANEEEQANEVGEADDTEEAENKDSHEDYGDDEQQENAVDEDIPEENSHEDAIDDLKDNTSGQDDASKSTSAKMDTGDTVDAADENVSEENAEGAAESGEPGAGAASGEQNDTDVTTEQENKASEEAESADKQYQSLGDQLREWQRARQIQEHQTEDMEKEADNQQKNIDDATDFAHIAEDEEEDTQALGNADKEQIKSLNVNEDQDEDASAPEPMDIDSQLNADDSKPKEDQETGFESKQLSETTDKSRVDELETRNVINQPDFDRDLEDYGEIEDAIENEGIITTTKEPPSMSIEEARVLWQQHEESTRQLSMELCEQLRLILEPTLATKMQGDFRTGKRLNMKRIIPYIASQFKKDKIWMRRVKPSKRTYQVMIAIDDSKSMSESKSTKLALETLALVTKSLSMLEVGQISVMKFGDEPELLHPFDKPFSSEVGADMFSHFSFEQSGTNVLSLTDASMRLFNYAGTNLQVRNKTDLRQLEIIISDGICEDHDTIRRILRRAQEEKVMIVFIILDNVNDMKKSSVLDINKVHYVTKEDGTMELNIQPYIDEFAFEYYLAVRNIEELPQLLSSALRQWFQQMSST